MPAPSTPPSSFPDDFALLFELSLDLLVVAGFDGYFKRLNPSWPRTFGFTMEEFFAVPNIEFVHPADREKTLAARSRLIDGVPLTGLINRYRCKDGSYRFLQWTSVSFQDRRHVYCVARDVTDFLKEREEREQLQQQLIFADRMASIGRLAAGVAHEINNPLSFIMANLRVALSELGGDLASLDRAELTAMLEESLAGAERVARIVRDLKVASRAPHQAALELVRVDGPLQLSMSMIAQELRRRAQVMTDFRPTPQIKADEARLLQVFLNLLMNAAQAIPEGQADANAIRVRTGTDEGGRAVVEVEDTGSGIAPEALPHIFDPFFTTKPVGVGTGLGLSITKSIVDALQGEVTVNTEVGKGTLFRVAFPPVGN